MNSSHSTSYQRIFDRPILLIGKDAQQMIMHLKIAVAGCGVLGSVLITTLARMGVSVLRVLDRGTVETVNLANSLFLEQKHIGLKKSEAAAELARTRSLRKIRATPYDFDVTQIDNWDRLNDFVAGMDLVYGCFDNLPARFSLNSAALVQDAKYIDLGIEGYTGRIRLIDRSRACYACNPLVPEDLSINLYSLTKGSQRGCDYAPTVTILPTAILTAAHAVLEGLKQVSIFLLQDNDRYDYLYYDFLSSAKPVKMKISKREDCRICGPEGLVNW